MTGSYRHKRKKLRLMLYFFKLFQTGSSKGHFKSTMDNVSDGSTYPNRHKSDRSNTVRDGRLLDTLVMRGGAHSYYSSFGFDRRDDHHHYHPYRRNGRGYLVDEFKREKPHTFDGDVK